MKMTVWPESLRDLVFIPRIDERLDELAALAEPEEWTWHSTPATRPKPVLFSYLLQTYKRLAEEGKIVVSGDGTQLTFNTGLATPNQERSSRSRTRTCCRIRNSRGIFIRGVERARPSSVASTLSLKSRAIMATRPSSCSM
jgi:hypothetical protein